MWIGHVKWDDCIILKCSRNISENEEKSLEHFTTFINFVKKPQSPLSPPHDLIITCTFKVFENLQRLQQQK